MAPVQTWANVAMVTLGISGALTDNKPMKWLCFGFGMVLGLIIFLVAFLIFHKVKTDRACAAAQRGRVLVSVKK